MRLAESLGFSGKKVKPDHKYDILRDDYLFRWTVCALDDWETVMQEEGLCCRKHD